MRLIGVAFKGSREWGSAGYGPVRDGFVPFGDFTGILGTNDSGKSSLLRLISDALDAESRVDVLIFTECSTEEFRKVTARATSDLREYDEKSYSLETRIVEGHRAAWWVDPYLLRTEMLEASNLPGGIGDPVEAWQQRLLSTYAGDRNSFESLLCLATDPEIKGDNGDRRILAFEPVPVDGASGSPRWNVLWCAPPFESMSVANRSSVEDLRTTETPNRVLYQDLSALGEDHKHFSLRRQVWAPKGGNIRMGGTMSRNSGARNFDEAPLVVAPVGRIDLPILPRPVFPRDQESVTSELNRVIGLAIGETRWSRFLATLPLDHDPTVEIWDFVEDSYVEPEDDFDHTWLTRQTIGSPWIVGSLDRGWRLNEELGSVLRRIERAATNLMPKSFSARYRVKLKPVGPTRWPEERIQIWVRPLPHAIPTNEDEQTEDLPFSQLAEGLKLWVQIALLRALEPIESIVSYLETASTHLHDEIFAGWLQEGEFDRDRASDLQKQVSDVLEDFADLGEDLGGIDGVSDLSFMTNGKPLVTDRALAEIYRGRLLLIDEPERFLHPGLQREMATWLVESSVSTQILAATHSVAFMNMPGDARYSYLLRVGASPTAIQPIVPRDLAEMSEAANELGLDRGELLALVKLVLWVEGAMDRVILETLFPRELREFGIVVVGMDGHGRARAILETSVMRFTSAATAVWLDKIDSDYARRVLNDPAFAETQLREVLRPNTEKATLARLAIQVHSEHNDDRLVVPIGVESPGDDIFDLLDEQSIQTLYPEYPGHEKAAQIWRDMLAQGKSPSERKKFWEKRFRTPITEESCRRIAEQMRVSGRIPQTLSSVILECQDLALRIR